MTKIKRYEVSFYIQITTDILQDLPRFTHSECDYLKIPNKLFPKKDTPQL
jgi:hypothetical protein